MYACNGILFNHESPRRGETFVTRKITRGLARIDAGHDDCLFMGNIDSLRDWGHARDYVEMQWRMLQQEGPPEDFVIATGRQESVRRFIELTAAQLGWGGIEWSGEGIEEEGRRAGSDEVVVRIDPRYFRPAEVETLLGGSHPGPGEVGLDSYHHAGGAGGGDGGHRQGGGQEGGPAALEGLQGGGFDGEPAHQSPRC